MVNFLGIDMANEVWILTVLLPLVFLYWYYKRVLTSQQVKVLYEYKTGNAINLKAEWHTSHNKITFKMPRGSFTGKSDVMTVKKKHEPKLIFFPPMVNQRWFRVMEGLKETVTWEIDKDLDKNPVDLTYEAIALLNNLISMVQNINTMSFKGQMMGIVMGISIGVAVTMLLVQLIPSLA
jgi:hypothetical protein